MTDTDGNTKVTLVTSKTKVASGEEKQISLHTIAQEVTTVIPVDRCSSYAQLKRVTAWMLRFLNDCRSNKEKNLSPHLTTTELQAAETYWVSVIQRDHFTKEMQALKDNKLYTIPVLCCRFTLSLTHPVCSVLVGEQATRNCRILFNIQSFFMENILWLNSSFNQNTYDGFTRVPIY